MEHGTHRSRRASGSSPVHRTDRPARPLRGHALDRGSDVERGSTSLRLQQGDVGARAPEQLRGLAGVEVCLEKERAQSVGGVHDANGNLKLQQRLAKAGFRGSCARGVSHSKMRVVSKSKAKTKSKTAPKTAPASASVASAPIADLPSRRYRVLVEQLAGERGHRYGWKSEVARILGISAAYVNQIDAGKKAHAGAVSIGRALEALNLNERFFYDPTLGDAPSYTDHVRTEEVSTRSASAHSVTFWRRVHEASRRLDAAVRAHATAPGNDPAAVAQALGVVVVRMRELVGVLEEDPLFGWYRTAVALLERHGGPHDENQERSEIPRYEPTTVARTLAAYAEITSMGTGAGRA